jgi:hypothetical protein
MGKGRKLRCSVRVLGPCRIAKLRAIERILRALADQIRALLGD